jgi:hypothetical protein
VPPCVGCGAFAAGVCPVVAEPVVFVVALVAALVACDGAGATVFGACEAHAASRKVPIHVREITVRSRCSVLMWASRYIEFSVGP